MQHFKASGKDNLSGLQRPIYQHAAYCLHLGGDEKAIINYAI